MADRQGKSGDEELGRLIRERRESLGLSRRDLADRTGLSYPYISQLETAYRLPSSKALQALARGLSMPASDLFQVFPSDTQQFDAQAAPQAAPSSRWIANPTYLEPTTQRPSAMSEEAVGAAVSALEALPAQDRLDALAKVQAAVLAGIVRDQSGGPSSR
jgi:transcriptional regulator with XRE-family HTH domain